MQQQLPLPLLLLPLLPPLLLLRPQLNFAPLCRQRARGAGSSAVAAGSWKWVGLAALGFGVLKARHAAGTLVTDDNGNQLYTYSLDVEKSNGVHKKNGAYATPQAARPRRPLPSTVRDRTSFPHRPPPPTTSSRGARRCP